MEVLFAIVIMEGTMLSRVNILLNWLLEERKERKKGGWKGGGKGRIRGKGGREGVERKVGINQWKI